MPQLTYQLIKSRDLKCLLKWRKNCVAWGFYKFYLFEAKIVANCSRASLSDEMIYLFPMSGTVIFTLCDQIHYQVLTLIINRWLKVTNYCWLHAFLYLLKFSKLSITTVCDRHTDCGILVRASDWMQKYPTGVFLLGFCSLTLWK